MKNANETVNGEPSGNAGSPANPSPAPAHSVLSEIETELEVLEGIPERVKTWILDKIAKAKAAL